MEALAAVSLTGNILQFVEFGGTVISRARQYHASINGRLQSHIELDDTINDFDKLLLKLRSPRVTGGDNASVEAAIGDVLQRRLDESISVGKEMREALDKVRIEGRKTLWKSTRKAIRMVWSEPRLAELQTRLDSIRRGLELVITIEQRHQLQQLASRQENITAVLDDVARNIYQNIVNNKQFLHVEENVLSVQLSQVHDDTIQSLSDKLETMRLQMQTHHAEMEGLVKSRAKADDQASSVLRLGMQLHTVSSIDEQDFIGRDSEMQELAKYLMNSDGSPSSKVAILSGLGGIGKTQLALQFAQRREHAFSSLILLDAASKNSLQQGFVMLARRISEISGHVDPTTRGEGEKEAILRARLWLSEACNSGWLLIMDNYDDPSVPGFSSTTGYDIREFYPQRLQGSIIITSRSKIHGLGKVVHLQKMRTIEESVDILLRRSGREQVGKHDPDAYKLAQRLDGLPLALSTAGAYLRDAPETFASYLQIYEEQWHALADNTKPLPEYHDSVLYTTWDLSYSRISEVDANAAALLLYLAYFDPRDMWFELFQQDWPIGPEWLRKTFANRLTFNRTVKILQDYSLIDVSDSGVAYSMHQCVHDWLNARLQRNFTNELYNAAMESIKSSCASVNEPNPWQTDLRMDGHLVNIAKITVDLAVKSLDFADLTSCAVRIGYSLKRRDRLGYAETMLECALKGDEKTLGPNNLTTLHSAVYLGLLYKDQRKLDKAQELLERALKGIEEGYGPLHKSALDTTHNLGLVYRKQGKLDEAERLLLRALEGTEQVLGTGNTYSLETVNILGLVYRRQGKFEQAEEMCHRALVESEKAFGPQNKLTLDAVNNLGLVYQDQKRYTEGEKMLERALEGSEQTLGREHRLTLKTAYALELLRKDARRNAR